MEDAQFGENSEILMTRLYRSLAWRYDVYCQKLTTSSARLALAIRWRRRRSRPRHGLATDLIVSVTSYPARFATLALTLKCLLTQSVRPDALILWVAHEDLDRLPADVTALIRDGLEVRATHDIRSYKKSIPTLRAFPNATIVTADDDLFYSPDWLKALVDGALKHPGAIICHRAHRPLLDSLGAILPYGQWEMDVSSARNGAILFPTTGAGALYPPNSLHPHVLDEETFLELAPMADDIWLFFMARLAKSDIIKVATRMKLIAWPGSQEKTLWSYNGALSGNDVQYQNVSKHFDVIL